MRYRLIIQASVAPELIRCRSWANRAGTELPSLPLCTLVTCRLINFAIVRPSRIWVSDGGWLHGEGIAPSLKRRRGRLFASANMELGMGGGSFATAE